jgi:hypothetical protein
MPIVHIILLVVQYTGGPAYLLFQRLGNQELEWKQQKSLNIGLDLGLWKNKVTLSAEYTSVKQINLILNVTASSIIWLYQQ